ncbi:MAG TPA: potassium channel protein [Candidatus Baltobacteraceae bacterium]|nr:potassium channel protein [Candidatus Baltobacteraceae bacterium]
MPIRASSSLVKAAGLLAVVVLFGTMGYVELEHWSWFDSFYMTIMTITTVGNGEPQPLNLAGKWLSIGVVVFGFAALTYTVLRLMAYMVEGRLETVFASAGQRRRVSKMENHYILCGYGRVGREIANAFKDGGTPFVVIDINEDSLRRASTEGCTVVHGDAAESETLRTAGVERARGLVAAVDSDEKNIYVTLSARVLNPRLFIIARANWDNAEEKLRLAGANRIISPYAIGGRRMASLAVRPTAIEFVDTVLSARDAELLLEDFSVSAESKSRGKTISELVPESSEMIVLALKRDGRMTLRPPRETRLEQGDEIVVAGPPEDMRSLEAVV